MFASFTRIAGAACSLMLTTIAVGAAVDGHAAASAVGSVAYASVGTDDTRNG